MKKKFILNFCPTGMIPMKDMTPYVPIMVEEVIDQVLEAAGSGVNMVHLHARDPESGDPTYKKDYYAHIIKAIRKEYPDLIICVTPVAEPFQSLRNVQKCLTSMVNSSQTLGA